MQGCIAQCNLLQGMVLAGAQCDSFSSGWQPATILPRCCYHAIPKPALTFVARPMTYRSRHKLPNDNVHSQCVRAASFAP